MARTRPGDPLMQCILRSMALHVAVLDVRGRITYASRSWRRFAKLHGLEQPAVDTDADYFELSKRLSDQGLAFTTAALAGISRVLSRELPHFSLEHSWPSRKQTRWFLMRVDPMPEWHGGVVISHVDITGQVRARQELQDGLDRYCVATIAGGVAMWDWDVTTGAMRVDSSLPKLLGYAPYEIPDEYDAWQARIHPEDRDEFTREMARHLEGRTQVFEFEHRKVGKRGEVRWFLARGSIVRDTGNRPVRVLGLDTDTTYRKEAELALSRQTRRYQEIFEAAGSAIWEADLTAAFDLVEQLRQAKVTDVRAHVLSHPELVRSALEQAHFHDANPQAVRMMGIPKPDLLRRPLMTCLLDAERHFLELLVAIAENRDHYTAEAQLFMACGGLVDIVFTARFPLVRGPTDYVLLCAHDVTELVSTRRRYELATAAGGVSVFEFDLWSRELNVDPVLNSVIGGDPAQTRTYEGWLATVHREDRSLLESLELQLISLPRVEADFVIPSLEFRLLHTDGSIRWVLSRSTLVSGAGGKPVRVVGTITDITRLKTTEEALRRSHTKIQELAGRLIEAQETERRRIARELHDDINQQLAGAAIALSNLERQLDAPRQTIQERLVQLQAQLGDLITSVRRLSHEMHPGVLEHAGLIPALRSLSRDFAAEDVDVQIEAIDVNQQIPMEIALCCYRVVQEALRTIVINTPTRSARVILALENDTLVLRTIVNGLGPPDPDWPIGLGLVALRERVRLVGGDLHVCGTDTDAAEIRAAIPIAPIEAP